MQTAKWVFPLSALFFISSLILFPYNETLSFWLKVVSVVPFTLVFFSGTEEIFFSDIKERWADGLFLVVFVGFGLNVILEYYALGYNFYDTGFITNPVYNFIKGLGYYNSELEMSEFGDHFNPGLLLLAPLLMVFTNPIVAPIIKWILFGLTYYSFKRLLISQKVGESFMAILLILWTVNIGTTNYMGFEVQASNLMMPFIFFSIQNLLEKKWVRLLLNLALIFSLKENGSLVILALGVFALFLINQLRVGVILTFLGAFFLYAVPTYIMPWLSNGAYIHQGILDPFCCLTDKSWFAMQVILCSGGILLFFPESYPVVFVSLLASLLINRPGAHTLTFHYQDIPLAFSYGILAVVVGRNGGFLPGFLSDRWNWRMLFAFVFCCSLIFNRFTFNYYFEFNKVNYETFRAVEELDRFKNEFDGKSKLWVQTPVGFNLSSYPTVKCIMNASSPFEDKTPNYIILSPCASSRWPIENDYESIIQRLELEVKEGKRQKLQGYQSLLVYKKD